MSEHEPTFKFRETSYETNPLWTSTKALGEDLTKFYSVTSQEDIKRQYIKQVEQYPLFPDWLKWIVSQITQELELNTRKRILEYGSGPGLLAEIIKNLHKHEYCAVEPVPIFRQMTKAAHPLAKVIDSTAENYDAPYSADIVCATATYHHFEDKPKAIRKIFENLKPGGKLLVGDVFFPEYTFDKDYNPTNRQEFLAKSIEYASLQILHMKNPDLDAIQDQLKTFLLDTIRYEELKVCLGVLLAQLRTAGFINISARPMLYEGQNIGWYTVAAQKP